MTDGRGESEAERIDRYGSPDFKPAAAVNHVKSATQDYWDDRDMDRLAANDSGFVYLDRVAPDVFVGRYNHGTCDAVHADAAKHTELDTEYGVKDDDGVKMPREQVAAVAARNHAYVVTITPEGSQSVCLYCGATMDGYIGGKKSKTVWKAPFDGPRRATEREAAGLGIVLANQKHRLLYLDRTWPIHTGRFRVGKCPNGGPHEAVLCWWRYEDDVRQSFCMFCGERWDGPPPGFWEVAEQYNTVERALEIHEEYVRRGLY